MTARPRWRPLLVLTAAVLAVHLWLLRPAPGAFQAAAPRAYHALTTRTIVMPVAPPALPPPAEVAAPVPARARPPAVAKARSAAAAPPARIAARATAPAAAASTAASHSAAASRVAIPGSVLLRYKVSAQTRGIALQGNSRLHWQHDGAAYEAKLELSGPLLPSRTQHSSGRITAEGLAPLRFSDKARSEEAAHFRRDEGKVSFSSNRPDAALMAGAQDRLSVMLQLASMIAGDPARFGPGATIIIQTAGTRDAQPWQFAVEGEETLQLPGGSANALKLTRSPHKEFDQKVELWLALDMDYVPVRLRLTQPNGDWVDQQWSSTDKG